MAKTLKEDLQKMFCNKTMNLDVDASGKQTMVNVKDRIPEKMQKELDRFNSK